MKQIDRDEFIKVFSEMVLLEGLNHLGITEAEFCYYERLYGYKHPIKFWTAEEDTLLIENYANLHKHELWALFPYRKYSSITSRSKSFNLHKNPAITEKCYFNKGMKPYNTKRLGSLRFEKDGYIMIKSIESKKWELLQRFIYRTNFGEIPDGLFVGFKDGFRYNFHPDNLELIDKAEMMRRNTFRNSEHYKIEQIIKELNRLIDEKQN